MKAFLETLSWEGIVFNFYIVVRRENSGRIWYQDVFQLLKRQQRIIKTSDGTLPLPFGSFLKASNPLQPLCISVTVSQNVKYEKLQIMDWNVIWHVSFFLVLKLFSLSIFICPINLPKFCKFPISNCTGCSVRLYSRNQWIVYSSLTRIWILLNLCHCLRLLKCFKLLIVLTTWMDPKTKAY